MCLDSAFFYTHYAIGRHFDTFARFIVQLLDTYDSRDGPDFLLWALVKASLLNIASTSLVTTVPIFRCSICAKELVLGSAGLGSSRWQFTCTVAGL